MAFLNFSLLAGGLLVGLPILLHLVMRQRPKQLVFPALRFIQQRREANRRHPPRALRKTSRNLNPARTPSTKCRFARSSLHRPKFARKVRTRPVLTR